MTHGPFSTVGEFAEALSKYPKEALLVFDDCMPDEEGEYEGFEVKFNADGEVIVRAV